MSMKKYVYIVLAAIICACTGNKDIAEVSSFDIDVTASEGALSFLIDTDGVWTAEVQGEWMSLDRTSADGRAAVTLAYQANTPISSELCEKRTGKLLLTKADMTSRLEISIHQFGLNSSLPFNSSEGSFENEVFTVEYYLPEYEMVSAIYCSSDGLVDNAALQEWLCSEEFADVDVKIIDKGQQIVSDILFVFDTFEKERNTFSQVKNFIECLPSAGRRIVGGTLWYKSVMEVGCVNTPEGYPTSVLDPVFDADRYCWQNRWSDCIWLKYRSFTPTYSENYRTDYIYADRNALTTIRDVQVMPVPVEGMLHNPLKILLTR